MLIQQLTTYIVSNALSVVRWDTSPPTADKRDIAANRGHHPRPFLPATFAQVATTVTSLVTRKTNVGRRSENSTQPRLSLAPASRYSRRATSTPLRSTVSPPLRLTVVHQAGQWELSPKVASHPMATLGCLRAMPASMLCLPIVCRDPAPLVQRNTHS